MFFLRIDDRFIHGQVGVAWVGHVGAAEVLLANDELAADSLRSTMQKLCAPPGVKVIIKPVKEAAAYVTALPPQRLDKLFVIVASPGDVLRLLDAGVKISEVNIGHMGASAEKKEVYPKLFVGSNDLTALQELERRGVALEFRLVPAHKKVVLKFSDMTLS